MTKISKINQKMKRIMKTLIYGNRCQVRIKQYLNKSKDNSDNSLVSNNKDHPDFNSFNREFQLTYLKYEHRDPNIR